MILVPDIGFFGAVLSIAFILWGFKKIDEEYAFKKINRKISQNLTLSKKEFIFIKKHLKFFDLDGVELLGNPKDKEFLSNLFKDKIKFN